MSVPISHQKLAEYLFILNDRQIGVLTRLYHMKQELASTVKRPAEMPNGDKMYESAWKALLKKFPSNELKSGQSNLQPFITNRKKLFEIFSVYYYNLLDILEVNIHFNDLIVRISASQIELDITVNSDITRLYLELISNHFALMFFLTRLPDVKAILALFNFLYEQMNGKSEPNFPRMHKLLADSPENMVSVLHRDIQPHYRLLSQALSSLNDFFVRRTVRAKNWSDGHFLSVLNEPGKITHTVLGDQLACELVPYEVMERWIVFGYLLIYPTLSDEEAFNRLKMALRHTYVVVIFRDEVVYIHALFQSFLESVWTNKVGNKRISEIKETLAMVFSQTIEMHNDRRGYLRTTLRQLHLILSDEPGLLGPKAFLVFWGLSYASDEIHWLLRHMANPPPKKIAGGSSSRQAAVSDDFGDPLLPELLFYVEELRRLIVRYTPVIQRFYLKLLACFDAPGLVEYLAEVLPSLPSDDAAILSSISKRLSSLADDPSLQEDMEYSKPLPTYDFVGVRLDWSRVQASLSLKGSPFKLSDHKRLVEHLHSTILHTKMVDYLDELLRLVSDMSIFNFYPTHFRELFNHCIQCPAQLRFSIVFPSLCSHMVNGCHDLCPDERHSFGQTSVRLADDFCKNIASYLWSHFLDRANQFGKLEDQLAAACAVPWLFEEKPGKKKVGGGKRLTSAAGSASGGTASMPESQWSRQPAPGNTTLKAQAGVAHGPPEPGLESVRRNRQEQTLEDKTLFNLSQLCQTVNHYRELIVYDRVVSPREILQKEIQRWLIELLAVYTELRSVPGHDQTDDMLITKPSELLRHVHALMNALLDLEHHVCLDVVSIFSNVFGQHTQLRDGLKGQPTMTAHYTKWYTEHFLKHAYQDHFIYSPLLKSFVTPVAPEVVRFRAEDFADLNELRDLAELIGPLGIKNLCDQLMIDVGHRVTAIKQLVLQNRSTLELLRECFDDPVKTKMLGEKLHNSDRLLDLLKEVGVAMAFRNLCLEALHGVLERRTPFLLSTIKNLRSYWIHQSGGQLLPPSSPSNASGLQPDQRGEIYARLDSQLMLNNVSATLGILSHLDYSLCVILNNQRSAALAVTGQLPSNGQMASSNLEYQMACLFIVFVANALPRLARQEGSLYRIHLEASGNNCHCIAYSVNALMVAMFSLFRPGDLEARSKEFLALASSNLLRLGLESLPSSEATSSSSSTSTGAGGASSSAARHRDSIYILFDKLVRLSPHLSHSLVEACFPYSLVRSAHHNVAKLVTPLISGPAGGQQLHHQHMTSSTTMDGKG